MTVFLRLRLWLRRPVMLRLHVSVPAEKLQIETLEGIFVGFKAGHYLLANARQFETSDASLRLEGVTWIPRGRVFYAQEVKA